MTYLAKITTWVNDLGPFALGVAFFIGAYLAVGAYAIFVWIKKQSLQNSLAKATIERSGVNPIEKRFERQRIKMGDFFNPFYTAHKSKVFDQCQIWGPANIYLMGASIISCTTKFVEVVIVKDGATTWGATAFDNPTFLDCELCNLTLLMNKVTYDHICKNAPDFAKYIPVISC